MLRESSNTVRISVEIDEGIDAYTGGTNKLFIDARSTKSIDHAEELLLAFVTKIVESIDGVQLMVVS